MSIVEIESLNREQLRLLWYQYYGNHPPPKTSQILMRKVLAFYHQVKSNGGLDRKTKNQIARLQQKIITPEKAPCSSLPIQLKPGTRLLRQWRGKTHSVEVLKEGYRWQNKHYRSLSAIAKEITSTNWSGPRFFGLKNQPPEPLQHHE